jgi:pimeloyl-ACP methyl ester carboxylesterase
VNKHLTSSGCPIAIESQGSFYVGGKRVTGEGLFDPSTAEGLSNSGQTFWIDQMYVQYQIPANVQRLPLILVHGGGGTGRVWESTPDGREGFQTIFLRRGHPVYIVDAPRGGRSGFPSFNGEFGWLDERGPVVPSRTARPGCEHAWTRWRLGPKYPESFPIQAFPMQGVDQFLQHVRPLVSDDPEVVCGALIALLEKIGPAVMVAHSNGGLWTWLTAARSPIVKAVVAYEPGFVFPRGQVPDPLPLFQGAQIAGAPITAAEFAHLARIPVQVVYGDNIPEQPTSDLVVDGRRAQAAAASLFVEALNRHGGKASVLHLPKVGLRGNSHFMFSDLNNTEVADQLSAFLSKHSLDGQ